MKRISVFLFLIYMMTLPCSSRAQSDANAPLILELPTSTRGLGLGGTFVLSVPDADAIFAAPSVLNNARGTSFSLQNYNAESTLMSLSTAVDWSGGTLSIGLQSLSYGTPGRSLSAIPDDTESLLSSEQFAGSEFVGSIGYGRSIKGMQVGVTGKFIEMRIAGFRDGTAAADVGIARNGYGITWSLSAFNLGPGLTIKEKLPLPHRVTFGASSRSRQAGPLDYIGTTSVSRLRDGDIVPAAGIEISYWPVRGRTFTGRIGVRRIPDGGANPITFGAAFTSDSITIEYAFEGFDVPGSAHRIGISWR